MPKHIGIVGCSAEGASLCYRTICQEGSLLIGKHEHPEVSVHTPSLARYVDCLDSVDLEGVAALMLDSARKLARIGADFLICPDNTIHQAFDLVVPHSPLPWLHIAEVVADVAVKAGYSRLGLLGTAWLVESEVYPAVLTERSLTLLRPSNDECREINRMIMDELVMGDFSKETAAFHLNTIRNLASAGADAVILGCTEIPLIVGEHNSPLPVLDSTRLLARAALQHALC